MPDPTGQTSQSTTTPLLDAVPDLESRELVRALDEAVARRVTSPTKLRELLERHPHARGRRQLAPLADPSRRSRRTESELAADALALEVDSFRWHGPVEKNFHRDRHKDRAYPAHDIEVVRWSDEDLTVRRIEVVTQLAVRHHLRSARRG